MRSYEMCVEIGANTLEPPSKQVDLEKWINRCSPCQSFKSNCFLSSAQWQSGIASWFLQRFDISILDHFGVSRHAFQSAPVANICQHLPSKICTAPAFSFFSSDHGWLQRGGCDLLWWWPLRKVMAQDRATAIPSQVGWTFHVASGQNAWWSWHIMTDNLEGSSLSHVTAHFQPAIFSIIENIIHESKCTPKGPSYDRLLIDMCSSQQLTSPKKKSAPQETRQKRPTGYGLEPKYPSIAPHPALNRSTRLPRCSDPSPWSQDVARMRWHPSPTHGLLLRLWWGFRIMFPDFRCFKSSGKTTSCRLFRPHVSGRGGILLYTFYIVLQQALQRRVELQFFHHCLGMFYRSLPWFHAHQPAFYWILNLKWGSSLALLSHTWMQHDVMQNIAVFNHQRNRISRHMTFKGVQLLVLVCQTMGTSIVAFPTPKFYKPILSLQICGGTT